MVRACALVWSCRSVKRGLRASEFLRDFDRLRKGFISPAQFQNGLKTMDPSVNRTTLEALTYAYTAVEAAPPLTVDWRRFVSDLDDVLSGSRELEKQPAR
jgi:hypothetical protein